jgi:hypothetical protein
MYNLYCEFGGLCFKVSRKVEIAWCRSTLSIKNLGLNSTTSSCIDGSCVIELLLYVFPFNVAYTENDSMVLWLDLLYCYFLLLWLFGPFPGQCFTCFVPPITHTSCRCVPVFYTEQFGSIFLYMAPLLPLFLYVLVGLIVALYCWEGQILKWRLTQKFSVGSVFASFLAKQISTAYTHVIVSGVTVLTAAVICYQT